MVATNTGAAELIRLKRTQLSLSARSLSLAAGQSGSYVTKLEARQIEPSLKAFARLARALGLTASEIQLAILAEASRTDTTQ